MILLVRSRRERVEGARRSMLVASLLLALFAPAARAAWSPGGVELSPVPGTQQSFSLRGLASDAAAGAFVVWESQQPLPDFSGTAHAFVAQRVDVNGNRPSPWSAGGSTIRSFLVNGSFGTFSMEPLGLFEDGAGGAVFAALDYRYQVETLRLFTLYRISPAGVVTPVSISNSSFGGYPTYVAAADGDGAGGVVMCGLQQTFAPPGNPLPPSALFAQRLDASGQPTWPENVPAGIPGVELNTIGQTYPAAMAVLHDGAGGAFFAWSDLRQAGDPDVYVQHLDAGGAIAGGWPAGGVPVCDAPDEQYAPRLASDGAGGVFVVWGDRRSGDRIFGSHVLASGDIAPGILADGSEIPSGDVNDALVNLASDGEGGVFLVREGVTPEGVGISYVHRLDGELLPKLGWPIEGRALNTLSPSDGRVDLLADGAGGVYVTYRNGFGTSVGQGLFAMHLTGSGAPAPGWSATGYRLSGTGERSAIVRSGPGAIVAWHDWRLGPLRMYAQRLVPDGPVATQLALVSSDVVGDRVLLRWFSADGPAMRATVERRTAETDWAPLADIVADGTGSLDYVDATTQPGARYGYRLAWLDGESLRTGGEAWIERPGGLALESPRPNPSRDEVSLAVTLASAVPAHLDVWDVAGRRVAHRDLGGLGPGRHVLRLGELEAAAPGLYLVRLAQGGEARGTRLLRSR